MKKKVVAIDIELNETRSSGVAYYKLTREFKVLSKVICFVLGMDYS